MDRDGPIAFKTNTSSETNSQMPLPSRRAMRLNDVEKIDLHTHIIPQHWPDWNKEFGQGGWLTIRHDPEGSKLINDDGSIFRAIGRNCWSPEERIRECDESGVTIQVLSTVPGIGFNYGAPPVHALKVAQFLNNHISQVVRDEPNGRFLGLGTVPLQDPQLAVVELKRCVTELGLRGVQIGTSFDGHSLDSPLLAPFWQTVETLDCAVFVHPWDMSREERVQKYWFPWLLGMPHETAIAMGSLLMGGVLERHPKLRICFAHGGGCFPGLIGRISHGFNVRPDLCQLASKCDPKHLLDQVYVDSLVHDEDILKLILKKFGPDRIILGSDYPFPLGEIERPGSLIEESCLSEDPSKDSKFKEKLLYRNAINFLKLDFSD